MEKSQYSRRDRLVKEARHDAYQEWGKWPENSSCKDCGALFSSGRWTWKKIPEGSKTITCPACQRITDKYPAGQVIIEGPYFEKNRQELLNQIHNEEKKAKNNHPLERIMDIVDEKDKTLVTTTGIHIARRIGESLSKAYQGKLDFTYGDGEKSIRVIWSR